MKNDQKALTKKMPGLFNPGDVVVNAGDKLIMIIEDVQIPDLNDRYFKCISSSKTSVLVFSKYTFYWVVK